MSEIGKLLILVGAGVAVLGVIVWLLGRSGFRGLPGDIAYRGEGVQLYFPVVTCLVLSLLLTVGVWVWRWLRGG